jgi:hypothetical protein
MKKLLFVAFLILCPSIVLSHPGKTDRRGGHKCWKDCYEWELAYGEYHFHDKDFRPIRLDRDGTPKKPKEPKEIESKSVLEAPQTVLPEVIQKKLPKERPKEVTASTNRSETTTYDDSICSFDPLHYALLALVLVLLLVLLVIMMRRRKEHQ